MQKNKYNYYILIILLFFLLFLITKNKDVLESVSFSISLWKNNLFPTLFPFFVVSNLLLQYGFADIIGNLLNKPISRIFKINGNGGFALIISLFSGFPSGAKNTVNLLKNNKITYEEANKLLLFTHYSNPLFIIGFIGNILNKELAYLILFSHILAGLIVGKIFSINNKDYVRLKEKKESIKIPSFSKSLTEAINDSLNTIFMLLGIVTIFTIFSCLIRNYLKLPNIYDVLISGILEMTQGINKLLYLNISNYLKTILTTFFISFGGISIHIQVLSIIEEVKLKYKHFFIARIIHSIVAIMLVSILYFIIY